MGAGPAGATLARLVGRRYRTLLVDRRDPGAPGDDLRAGKCCGGLLAPDAQKMLSALGLGLPSAVLEDPQLFVVKAIDLQRGLDRCYQRHYINMNRLLFDGWLLSLVPPEVEVRTDCRVRAVSREEGRLKLVLGKGGKTWTEKARVVVGADGAHSIVRRQCFADRPLPREYFSIQEWVEGDHDRPYFTSLFDWEITDYYCWTIPKGDRLIVGTAVHPKLEATARFELLKVKLRRVGFKIGRTVHREGALIFRPTSGGQLCTADRGVALIGEAGGWISPSSAEGLSYAFRSALRLAEAVEPMLDGFEKRYHRLMGSLRRNLWVKNRKSPVIFNPVLRAAVMRSGLGSMEVHLGEGQRQDMGGTCG